MKGGRELADKAIMKNEKESHEAREEAKRAKEAAEHARCICILIFLIASIFFLALD
jgi:diacylglycerol kinase